MIVIDCFDRFNKKMALNGGSIYNERISDSKNLLLHTFMDDPSYFDEIYMWQLGLTNYDNETTVPMRMYGRSFSSANGATYEFQTLYDYPINVGDVVYNKARDEYFICTESNDLDSIHWQGKLTLCNWILKWQNKNREILEYPCYNSNSTQYNSGESSNKQFTIGSSQHLIYLPYDENTVCIASPQRFYLDRDTIKPTTYIVTQNDTTTYYIGTRGLIRVTVSECLHDNDTDRPDLGICDYVDPDTDSSKDTSTQKLNAIIESTSTVIKSGGNAQTFTAKFYDENNQEISGIVPVWNIVSDFSDLEENLYITTNDNYMSISIDNDKFVDEYFKLYLSDSMHICTTNVLIKIEGLL